MDMQTLRNTLPDTARDLRVNAEQILGGTEHLTALQAQAIVLAGAQFLRCRWLGAWAQVGTDLTASQGQTVATVTSLMAMTTTYYRTMHLSGNADLEHLPAQLRMQGFRLQPDGLSAIDQELVALACAVWAGCAQCIQSHMASLQRHGATLATQHTAIRAAAVVQAIVVAVPDA